MYPSRWKLICESILDLGSARTMDELFAMAGEAVKRFVPYDRGFTINQGNGFALFFVDTGADVVRALNDYYYKKIPFFQDGASARDLNALAWGQVEWEDYRDSEFVTDFARPIRMGRTLTNVAPGMEVFLNVHRTFRGPRFTDREEAILRVLSRQVDNTYKSLALLDELSSRAMPSAPKIAGRFPILTMREAEVLSLWIRGLSSSLIAARIGVSARTVESHLAHVYDKLGLRSKAEAMARLANAGPA